MKKTRKCHEKKKQKNRSHPDYTCSQHEELLDDRWLKHESPFKSVKSRGLSFFMLNCFMINSRCVYWLCERVCSCARWIGLCLSSSCIHTRMCVVDCACSSVWVFCWAQNQQSTTGIRISVALPWQQMNARAEGGRRIKAQSSSQQREKNERTWLKHHLCCWSPQPQLFSSSISVCCDMLRSEISSDVCRFRNAVYAYFHFLHAHAVNVSALKQRCSDTLKIQRCTLNSWKQTHHHPERCCASR